MRARTLLAGLVLALLVGSAFLFWRNFSDRNPRAIRASAQAVAAAQRDLARLGSVVETNAPAADLTPDTFRLLQAERHAVRDLVRAVLNSESPNASSEQLRNAVVQALQSAGATVADAEPGHNEGTPVPLFGRVTFQLERVLGHRNLVAAKVGTSIPCGTDGALYLFEREGSIWSPVLAYEAPQYSKISDAYGSIDYAVSPVTDAGWYLLVASSTPACSSYWQGLRSAAMRKGAVAEHPKTILNVSAGLYQGWEQFWKLRADSDTAQITWPSRFKLDGTILIRAHIGRYKITGDKVTRIHPVALYPEDFVDEWASKPWEESADWVAPEALADAEAVHKWLHGSDYAVTIEFLQACPIPDHWQMGLAFEATQNQAPPVSRLYVDVSRDGDIFRLDRIAPDRAPGCPGSDYLPQRPQSLP